MDHHKEQKYLATLKKASEKIKGLLAEIDQLKQTGPVAIIGMDCRFPGGSDSPPEFWHNLCEAKDAVTLIPEDRWPKELYFHPDPDTPGASYAQHGGFINGIDRFDHTFFNIPPAEAKAMDPQHRLLLEVSYGAIEDAGLNPDMLKGSRTGIFIGFSTRDYLQAHLESGDRHRIDAHSLTGTAFSTAVGRLSYFYDFQGPSLAIDTACSSALVSIHLAIQSLRKNESDLALAGGVNLLLTPEPFIGFSQLRALSPDGKCRTFDDGANGYVRGEGCGMVVLKRLADARQEGDRILAVIKGSAVNQDGESNGLTAPNALAQKRVIENALTDAKMRALDIDYIECHGTGTALGDPIEARALGLVFGERETPVKVGSVKTNIGHLEAAAGMAGIIKTVLALQKRLIPPSLHFKRPSHHIPWSELPIEVVDRLTPWPQDSKPAVAGVSAFGFSGTNAHLVIEAGPNGSDPAGMQTFSATSPPQHFLLPISAASQDALTALIRAYITFLEETDCPLSAICYSAGVSRKHYQHRLALIAATKAEARNLLTDYLNGRTSPSNTLFYSGTPQTCLPDGQNPLAEIAQHYCDGQTVNWQEMGPAAKVNLPHHPFIRSSFWIDPVYTPRKNTNDQLKTAPVSPGPPSRSSAAAPLTNKIAGRMDSLAVSLPEGAETSPTSALDTLEWTIHQQINLMSKQLALVSGCQGSAFNTETVKPTPAPPFSDNRPPAANVDIRSMTLFHDQLTAAQKQFIKQLITRYTAKTANSKKAMQTHRPWFSDWINSLGFRLTLKEIMYPIVCNQGQGPRLTDIDGNDYLDMAIGYGVNYFGNNAPFVVQAVAEQLKKGFQLGPQFDQTFDVARRITQLTGVERVTFSNTGTEAVMVALRIARTVTGRDKIVIFKDSYHGIFDGILAFNGPSGTLPLSPGTTHNMVADVIVLPYGEINSLDAISAHAPELAAVLVEPVQSRNPGLVPREFLRQLREITFKQKIALIFDEIITGFRLCPGGAQAYFNIQADLVTYGKVIGGGLPVSVIAGKARFMDAIDGGPWQYGDDSVPGKAVTFFGGTFCKHPLAMVAARAVLDHLIEQGPALQESVNRLTKQFADNINTWFTEGEIPIRVRYCASYFRFESVGHFNSRLQPLLLDLLFYLMLEKGVYTWERRICFFSTTHRQEDVNRLLETIKESVDDLRQGGFDFGRPPERAADAANA